MSIERNGFGYDMECDFCSHSQYFDTEHFQAMIAEAKTCGWKIFKEDGEWVHKCEMCQEKG